MANAAATNGSTNEQQNQPAADSTATPAAAGGTGNEKPNESTAANPEAGKAGGDGKTGEGDKGGAGKGKAADTPARVVPDKYELKLPEKTTLDASDVKAIETIAKENGWTNDEAQAALEQHHATLVEQSEQFLTATKADPTYGGENLAKSQARAKAVIDRVRPADHPRAAAFKALLDKSGYGNHIEILSFLADLGAMEDEDAGVNGDGTTGSKAKAPEDVLYGATTK